MVALLPWKPQFVELEIQNNICLALNTQFSLVKTIFLKGQSYVDDRFLPATTARQVIS